MTTFNAALPRRSIYVPQPSKGKTSPRPPLPRDLASLAATTAFRTLVWSGQLPTTATVPARVAPLVPPETPAREVFAGVAWTGERPLPRTAAQAEHSVATVMRNFRWE